MHDVELGLDGTGRVPYRMRLKDDLKAATDQPPTAIGCEKTHIIDESDADEVWTKL